MKLRVPLLSARPCAGTPQRGPERAVALVITLVLLAVITFMAIAFLVLSQAERGSVASTTDQAIARLGADAGTEWAKSQLLAPMRAFGDSFNYGLEVSTNYINPGGFEPGSTFLTNVNFEFLSGTASPLNPAQGLENLNNLQYNPRPPVFVTVPVGRGVATQDFRYYLDLNRNGVFDPTGLVPERDPAGIPIFGTNGLVLSNYVVGDPQWIGGLEFPDRRHSSSNLFLYRYATLTVPAGNTLDINSVHNYAKQVDPVNMARNLGDGFLRNQGVGPWEINLAAFLVDLNTNLWATNVSPYLYRWRAGGNEYTQPNLGFAFDDALLLLRYRYYDPNYNSIYQLGTVASIFGPAGDFAFRGDLIDGYSAGPVLTGPWPAVDNDSDPVLRTTSWRWAGANNPGRLFTTQDLLNRNKLAVMTTLAPGEETFPDRLLRAGKGQSTYDRYTFYRLLSQLGTDSAAEAESKMNLNYDNVVTRNADGVATATNFAPWVPVVFFTNAANRLLADAGYTFTVNEIQLYPTNFYTPSVHRLLQLAANLLDATTNAPYALPHVFRPVFDTVGQEIYVAGYQEVTDASLAYATNGAPTLDLEVAADRALVGANPASMVYGVPLILGAKKGLPNFNEFAMQTHVRMSRLLEFRRNPGDVDGPVVETNQMYAVAISNIFGLEAWNSYSNAYPRDLELIAVADMSSVLTNEIGMVISSNRVARGRSYTLAAGTWIGWTNYSEVKQSFQIPFDPATNQFAYISNATYRQFPPMLVPATHLFERNSGFAVPRWFMMLNTKVRFILVDRTAGRIVDYVNLSLKEPPLDLMAKLAEGAVCGSVSANTRENPGSFWCTNRLGGSLDFRVPTLGVLNQVDVGLNGTSDLRSFSLDPAVGHDAEAAIDGFRYNLKGWAPKYPRNTGKTFYRSNVFYAPLIPHRPVYVKTKWQVNDPLVHYTVGDLRDLQQTNNVEFISENPPLENIRLVNKRYQPWGGGPGGSSNPTIGDKELRTKDPLVTRSDDWLFPTNKFPNIGWIGRVHRGTPWQTVYLKPDPIERERWHSWTGNSQLIRNAGQINTNLLALGAITNDSHFSHPIHDRKLIDLFTSAFNDSASRGRMSINQPNLAAWSAVLGGVNVLPNLASNTVIQPAGPYDPTLPPPMVTLVEGINNTRRSGEFRGAFRRLGDLVAVPELTVRSPFLAGDTNLMSDAVYERIPQQVFGLLQCEAEPRFVVYSYGQALKPAPQSKVTSGPYFGMVTNYQVTAESATRTVFRVENPTSRPRIVIESFNTLGPD